MKSATETLEHRIREHAYFLWEANGRPDGRDDEFWHQARELVAAKASEARPKQRSRQGPASQSRRKAPARN